MLDREGWFSVTPEAIAAQQAARCMAVLDCGPGTSRPPIVLDAFAGVGGNTIQFALAGALVLALERDPARVAATAHNAAVYGVRPHVELVCGDYLALATRLKADVAFLSPPWGGPSYAAAAVFDVEGGLLPLGLTALLASAQAMAPAVAVFLPRNCSLEDLDCGGEGGLPLVAVERNLLGGRLKAITAYYGHPWRAVFSGTKATA